MVRTRQQTNLEILASSMADYTGIDKCFLELTLEFILSLGSEQEVRDFTKLIVANYKQKQDSNARSMQASHEDTKLFNKFLNTVPGARDMSPVEQARAWWKYYHKNYYLKGGYDEILKEVKPKYKATQE